jgi:hypothetical protein
MKLTVLEGPANPALANALISFEQQFTYPLGEGRRFTIAHDGNNWEFFHALGEAAYAIAESHDQILGVLGASLRQVVQPDGVNLPLLYLGDLKIAVEARGGMILLRLARSIQERFRERAHGAFSVVMAGTSITPTTYTGRMGIPAFFPVDAVSILWLRTSKHDDAHSSTSAINSVCNIAGLQRFGQLAAKQFRFPNSEPAVRSIMTPQWLLADDGSACGRIEDTMRAKRVTTNSIEDMRSAHLSCFSYRTLSDGLNVLNKALALVATAGYPLLFVAVAPADTAAMQSALSHRIQSVSTATVFSTYQTLPGHWNINTAEI